MIPQTIYNYRSELKKLKGIIFPENASNLTIARVHLRISTLEDKLALYTLPPRQIRKPKEGAKEATPKENREEKAKKVKERAEKKLRALEES